MPALIELIRGEIAAAGVLPFARFMELALYCPNYGYYQTKKDNPGRSGDFFTSVNVGQLFGQLLAFQFSLWLDQLRSGTPPPATLHLMEAGAHDGALAADVLGWLQVSRPGLFQNLQYSIIEPSPRRQEWQAETLQKFGARVGWYTDFEDLKKKAHSPKLTGVFFSNELLDAMPVRRFGWDARTKKWFEWGVALEGDHFVWSRVPESSDLSLVTRQVPHDLEAVLPDCYTVETSPAATSWWRQAADALGCGRLMTIDYGLTADELFAPGRPKGTLRAYVRHHLADDILANPGEQDITAHVNFPAIQAVGESAGLKTEQISTQGQFLTHVLREAMNDESFGPWTPLRTRQFQTLTHPEHLGRSFRVLIQSRS